MNKQIITADHLNATHLGKRITINSLHGTVVSGRLKEFSADYAITPSFTSYFPYKADKPLECVRDVHIILLVFRAGQRSRIGGQLATHCSERHLSGLQWHMNGDGFKPPPLFFSNQHPWISIPPKNHPTALSSEYSTLILDANAHTSQSNNLPAHVGKIHQAKTDRPLPYAQVPKPPCKPVPYDLQTTQHPHPCLNKWRDR